MAAKLIVACVALLALFSLYWLVVRPVLRANPTLKPIFDRLDEQEATFWGLFSTLVKGWKNIIWARFLSISGAVGLVMAEVLPDLQTIMQVPGLNDWLAPRWVSVLGLMLVVIGIVNERLRRATTGPVAPAPAPDAVILPSGEPVPDPAAPPAVVTEAGTVREVPTVENPAPPAT